MERVRDHYGIEIEVFMPDPARVEQMVREGGPDLFRRSVEERQRCCQVRKVEPLERALAGVDAWVTGLRRDQTAERAATPKVALERRGTAGQERTRFKLAPLADWSHEQVWSYLETHRVPHHPLYDRGFTSIGCLPCTRATAPGEDPRAGRWWWEQGGHKECGLHLVRDVVRGIGFHGQLAAGRR
jgi:phosphoadenylyl-sulfate reductase (thioredoxin)